MALFNFGRGHMSAMADPKVGEAMRAYHDYICAAEMNPHGENSLFSGAQLNTLLALKPTELRELVDATFAPTPMARVPGGLVARIKQYGRTLTAGFRTELPRDPFGRSTPRPRSTRTSSHHRPLF
jgi:hypothetical protein